MDLLDIIRQRPLSELPTDPPHCPRCRSLNVVVNQGEVSLTSSNNHHWDPGVCLACKLGFLREYKDGKSLLGNPGSPNVWYTSENHVLEGVPSCFESYTYDCNQCDGKIRRSDLDLISGNPVKSISYKIVDGKSIKQSRTVYVCDTCGRHLETPTDHWNP